jgi:hypothetical protein
LEKSKNFASERIEERRKLHNSPIWSLANLLNPMRRIEAGELRGSQDWNSKLDEIEKVMIFFKERFHLNTTHQKLMKELDEYLCQLPPYGTGMFDSGLMQNGCPIYQIWGLVKVPKEFYLPIVAQRILAVIPDTGITERTFSVAASMRVGSTRNKLEEFDEELFLRIGWRHIQHGPSASHMNPAHFFSWFGKEGSLHDDNYTNFDDEIQEWEKIKKMTLLMFHDDEGNEAVAGAEDNTDKPIDEMNILELDALAQRLERESKESSKDLNFDFEKDDDNVES